MSSPVRSAQASKNIGDTASQTGISVFAGNAHMNEAFMQTASKAWRKLAATRAFDEKSLQRAFRSIDIDGDGYLDTGEVRLAIKNIAPQITEMEITLMLATSDTDSDGKITFEEWQRLMMCVDEPRTPPSPAKAHEHTCIRARMASSQPPRHPAASRHSCCRRFPSADGSCASTRLASFCARFVLRSPQARQAQGHQLLGDVRRTRHAHLTQGQAKAGTLKRQPGWLTHQK